MNLAGQLKNVQPNEKNLAQPGNTMPENFAGLSTEQSADVKLNRIGIKRWRPAENARSYSLFCLRKKSKAFLTCQKFSVILLRTKWFQGEKLAMQTSKKIYA